MKIESKFNLGDKVWLGVIENPTSPDAYAKIYGPVIIDKVEINGTASRNPPVQVIEVLYSTNLGGFEIEQFMYATQEEAVAATNLQLADISRRKS